MMKRKLGWALQLPMIILMVVSLAVAIYAAKKGLYGITPGAGAVLGTILVLYLIGLYFVLKDQKEELTSWKDMRKNDAETEERENQEESEEEPGEESEEEPALTGRPYAYTPEEEPEEEPGDAEVDEETETYDENENADKAAKRGRTEETVRGYRRRNYHK